MGGHLEIGSFVLSGRTKSGEFVDLPEDEILNVIVERSSGGKTFLATLGVITLVAGVVILIALATKQSCPFVYTYTGENYVFDAEPLGGAVAKGLQKIDYSRLEHLRENK